MLAQFSFIIFLGYLSHSYVLGKVPEELRCNNRKGPMTSPFCLAEGYDKNVPPPHKEIPVDVAINVGFDDIVEINDAECTITFNILLNMGWLEPRLEILHNASTWNYGGTNEMLTSLGNNVLNHIWKPDLDIGDVKKFEIRHILEKQGFVGLTKTKRLWVSMPVQITLNCRNFEFSLFPFDTQFCEFWIGTFQWSSDHLLYKGNMVYNRQLQRPLQYTVNYIVPLSFEEGIVEIQDSYFKDGGETGYFTQNYSNYVMRMEFTRRTQAYLISTFLPSLLIVLSSWLGFVIGTASIPGRLTVTAVLLLVLINMRYNKPNL